MEDQRLLLEASEGVFLRLCHLAPEWIKGRRLLIHRRRDRESGGVERGAVVGAGKGISSMAVALWEGVVDDEMK